MTTKHSAESRIDDGGPAYPSDNFWQDAQRGMSLRDAFAKSALASMTYEWFEPQTRIQEMASEAYAIADAMLASRKPAVSEPEWIEWNGGNCPIDKGTMIQAEFRNGARTEMHPCSGIDTEWKHYKLYSDIIAYRIGGKP